MMKIGEMICGVILAVVVMLTMLIASVTAVIELPRYIRFRFK